MTTPPTRARILAAAERTAASHIHLRVMTGNIIGGTQLIAACGVRELETFQSQRRITKNLSAVTCAACRERARGGRRENV